jgi:7-cyano-7-deazaguanine synthase
VIIGSVAGDGAVHSDGTTRFVASINDLVKQQEPTLAVEAPAITLRTAEVVARAALPETIARWSHSCHRSALACGTCTGCQNRQRVLDTAFGN